MGKAIIGKNFPWGTEKDSPERRAQRLSMQSWFRKLTDEEKEHVKLYTKDTND